MIEFVTIDDRSEIETAVRFYEKLATDDKVDLLLPPWGSAMNFAIAPVADKYGYPMIGPTAISGKLKELALPYFYTMLVQPEPQMRARPPCSRTSATRASSRRSAWPTSTISSASS